MYLDEYKIEGTVNNDQNPCFNNTETYPKSVSYTHLTLPTSDLV